MTYRLMLMLLLLLVIVAVAGAEDASPVVSPDKWETSPVQAVAPVRLTGVAVSREVARFGSEDQYALWLTGGAGRDGMTDPDAVWGLFAGADTNARILPLVSQLLDSVTNGKARVGLYWSFQSDEPFVAVRTPFFSW